MMRRLLVTTVLGAFLVSLGGCVVHTRPARHSSASRAPQCKPSQYWDGKKCRHKGKGHGARKHDD